MASKIAEIIIVERFAESHSNIENHSFIINSETWFFVCQTLAESLVASL